jgi:hypothetical protein
MPNLYSLGDSFDNSITAYGTKVCLQLLNELDVATGKIKRSPRSYDVEITNAVTAKATQVTLTDLPVGLSEIPVGSSLVYTVGNVDHVWKVEEKAVAGNLTIDCGPVPVAITAGTEVKVYPMFQLLGGNTIGLKMNDKEVETRAFESNIWSDAKKVMAGATGDWSGYYPLDDEAWSKVVFPCSKSSQEVFVEIIYSNGMIRYGSAYLQGYNESAKNDETVNCGWTFRFVTEIFFRDAKGVLI